MVQTYTGNVITNGGAEIGDHAEDFTSTATPYGWSPFGGAGLSAVGYDIGDASDLNTLDSAMIGGGDAYFSGGLLGAATESEVVQVVDLSWMSTPIDSGAVSYDVSGWFGGYLSQNDSMELLVFFEDASLNALGSATIGGVTAADRSGVTELLQREATGLVPAGTRRVELYLVAHRTDGTYCDGYADNLSLTFAGPDITSGYMVVDQTHDYRGETMSGLNTIDFHTMSDSVATFSGSQFTGGLEWGGSIGGDAYANEIKVVMGDAHLIDSSGLEFSAWTSGQDSFVILAGGGDDSITGSMVDDSISSGGGNDTIYLDHSAIGPIGSDTVKAGPGDDIVEVGSGFTSDRINGGGGSDTIELSGWSGKAAISAAMACQVEVIRITGSGWTSLSTANGVVAAGAFLTVDASQLSSDFTFDGKRETNGHFILYGGVGADHLAGGGVADILFGGLGKDVLTGRGGGDVFLFSLITETGTGAQADQITDFVPGDHIDLSTIDANSILGGDQAFHLGQTPGHAGDIVVVYDSTHHRTTLSLYIDADSKADGEIVLNGNHADLTDADFVL